MPDDGIIKINGVMVSRSEIKSTHKIPSGVVIVFKTGVSATIPAIEQKQNAALWSGNDTVKENEANTFGYNLNGVIIKGSDKSDCIFLNNSEKCQVETNNFEFNKETKNDAIYLKNCPPQKNLVKADDEDQLSIMNKDNDTTARHNGPLDGYY